MRHQRLCAHRHITALVLVIALTWSGGRADSDGSPSSTTAPELELLQCYNGGPALPPATFEAFLRKGSEPSCLVLHRVLWSSKTSSLPLTVLAGLTLSRLDALRAQCASWAGPLSAAVYIPLPAGPDGAGTPPETLLTSAASDLLSAAEQAVQAVFNSAEHGAAGGCQLRLLLLYERVGDDAIGALLPINVLRNAALTAASTPLVAMVDVDLLISASLARQLAHAARAESMQRACTAQRSVLILPAFETAKALPLADGCWLAEAATKGPKKALAPFLASRQLHPFALFAYARGHNATDYPAWLATREPYRVEYQINYEPWFVIDRTACPPYDVRFRGYGWNKVAQVMLVNASGFSLLVHPSAFLVHRPHGRSDAQGMYSAASTSHAKAPQAGRHLQAAAGGAVGVSRAKLFHRKVAALRHKVMELLKQGAYQPVVDEQSRRCRGVLPWWRAEGGAAAAAGGGGRRHVEAWHNSILT